jgi:hypothetical protein
VVAAMFDSVQGPAHEPFLQGRAELERFRQGGASDGSELVRVPRQDLGRVGVRG